MLGKNPTDQLAKLDALLLAAYNARKAARRGDLFASREGRSLILAMHDLTEVDALFDAAREGLRDFASDVERELGQSTQKRAA